MRRTVLITFCGLGLLAPAGALASGGPVPPVLGGAGISVAGSPYRFIAVAKGPNTLVERVRRDSGTVERSNLLSGAFGVPGVAYAGSNTGLSADGRTLVLAAITNSYPPTTTRIVVLDAAGGLQPRARIVLPGSFTVDAISPTGRWLYLVHYRSPANVANYEVQAYDLAHRHLVAKPVVDPRHPNEKMQGVPLTRTTSADGRWAYTLYQSFTGAPFIHALDTVAHRAFCVDLPMLSLLDLSNINLTLSPATTLRIESAGTLRALMDTRTFVVQRPNAAPRTFVVQKPNAARPGRRTTATGGVNGSGLLWALGIGLAVALLAGVMLAHRRRESLIAHPPMADSH